MEVLMTKYIRVDYSVKPDVDLDELKAAIGEFVAGIRSHHPEHRYTSFQHPADPFRFIHIGEVVEEVLPDLQKQSFFQHFTGYLRERCSAGPEVTRLDRVASTAAQRVHDGSRRRNCVGQERGSGQHFRSCDDKGPDGVRLPGRSRWRQWICVYGHARVLGTDIYARAVPRDRLRPNHPRADLFHRTSSSNGDALLRTANEACAGREGTGPNCRECSSGLRQRRPSETGRRQFCLHVVGGSESWIGNRSLAPPYDGLLSLLREFDGRRQRIRESAPTGERRRWNTIYGSGHSNRRPTGRQSPREIARWQAPRRCFRVMSGSG